MYTNNCPGCKENYETPLKRQRFCSRKCLGKSKRFTSVDQYKQDRHKKILLIEKRGHQCEVCKNTMWMGQKIPLELDHIDGHPGHGTEDNLRLICPNCHAQTSTHAGKNVGKHSGTLRQVVYERKYPDYRQRLKDIAGGR